jgi:hypothetical protein
MREGVGGVQPASGELNTNGAFALEVEPEVRGGKEVVRGNEGAGRVHAVKAEKQSAEICCTTQKFALQRLTHSG